MRIIVIGSGRVGARLAVTLADEGHDVVVVDNDSDAFGNLGSEFGGEMVLGTGIDEDVLHKAGVEEADAVACVTSDDNTNIMAAQVAKHIFGVQRVVARIFDPEREFAYNQLGLETVSPTTTGAAIIRNLLTSNGLTRRAVLGSGEVEMFEAVVRNGVAGKVVREIEQSGIAVVSVVIRDGRAYVPTPEMSLASGDKLIMSARTDCLKRVRLALGL